MGFLKRAKLIQTIVLLLQSGVLCLQNSYGTIVAPYKTYRRLAASRHFEQLLPLTGFVVIYFWWASAIRVGIRHPFILAKNWLVSATAAGVTFALTVGGIYLTAKLVRGKGGWDNLVLPWAYSLLPTLAWFYFSSLSFVLLPPPRYPTIAGRLFSFLFVVGSILLFLWKGILYYLTLRFGMKLDLLRIVLVSTVVFPCGAAYAVLLYRLGIFRVPFI